MRQAGRGRKQERLTQIRLGGHKSCENSCQDVLQWGREFGGWQGVVTERTGTVGICDLEDTGKIVAQNCFHLKPSSAGQTNEDMAEFKEAFALH